MKIVGEFVAGSLKPYKSIIAMDYPSLQAAKEHVATLQPKPTHWVLSGMMDDQLMTLYEEKDGTILIDKFEEERGDKMC